MLHKFLRHKVGIGLVIAGLVLVPSASVFAQAEGNGVDPTVSTEAQSNPTAMGVTAGEVGQPLENASHQVFLPLVAASVTDNVADDVQASGTVVTGTQQIYAYFNKNGNDLRVNYWDGANWGWKSLNAPPNGMVGNPGVISYVPAHKQTRYNDAFVRDTQGQLFVNSWDGAANAGTLLNLSTLTNALTTTVVAGDPTGLVTAPGTASQGKYVFFIGRDGHLYMAMHNGLKWVWPTNKDLGLAPGGVMLQNSSAPGVITHKDVYNGADLIYVFVTGTDGRLYLKYGVDGAMVWAEDYSGHGIQPIEIVGGTPGVITYRAGNNYEIYAFVRGIDGHLYLNSFVYENGSSTGTWKWEDRGTPRFITLPITSAPGVITYVDADGTQRIYAFVKGSDGQLYVYYRVNGTWRWTLQGTPVGTTVAGEPNVTTYRVGTQPQRIYAFVKGNDGQLYVNFWNNVTWQWALPVVTP